MRRLLLIILLLCFSQTLHAQLASFPTAEGSGALSVGGRGGVVMHVTTLNDSGEGSLRACVLASGARICVFDVAGTILLSSNIIIKNSYITIAGQTAPGTGVQLKNYGLWVGDGTVAVHDVIIRNMKVRPGLDAVDPITGTDLNACLIYGGAAHTVYNVVIDHCECEWSTDQNGPDAYNRVDDTTVQWTISAEGAMTGHTESKNPHSMGILTGLESATAAATQNITYHHNLLADNLWRNPRIGVIYPGASVDPALQIDFRNNVIYGWVNYTSPPGNGGWGGTNIEVLHTSQTDANNWGTKDAVQLNLVKNYYKKNTNDYAGYGVDYIAYLTNYSSQYASRGVSAKIYTLGNIGPLCAVACDDFTIGIKDFNGSAASEETYKSSSEFAMAAVTTTTAEDAKTAVLAGVGAFNWNRDAVTSRIVADVTNDVGYFGPDDDDTPHYPTLSGTKLDDTDNDGISDSWENSHGLDYTDPADASGVALSGYTHIENYINELAEDTIDAGDYSGDPPYASIVTSVPITNIKATSATAGGNITDDGNGTISGCGVAWGTSPDPTTSGSHTEDGCVDVGVFASSITGLAPCTYYYIRAYSTNQIGTTYINLDPIKPRGECATGDWTQAGAAGTVTVDAVTAADGSGFNTKTFSHTVSADATLLIVDISGREADKASATSVTYAGAALTKLDYSQSGSTEALTEVWYKINPATGANNVVANITTASNWGVVAISLKGADIADLFGTIVKSNSSGSTSASNAVSSATGQLAIDFGAIVASASSVTVGASQTERWNTAYNTSIYGVASTELGAATNTMSWSWTTSSANAFLAVPVKALDTTEDYWYTTMAVKPYKVKSGATALTEVGSLVEMAENTWYWDDATDRLYVQTDGANPGAVTILCGPNAPNSLLGVW